MQFEEVDNLKNSISLTSELPIGQDDPNLTNQQDFTVPSFHAHFSVPSPVTKQTDRGKSNKNRFSSEKSTEQFSSSPSSSSSSSFFSWFV